MPATVPSAPTGPESPHRSFGKKIRDDYFFVSPYINPIGVSEPKTSMTDRVLVLDIDETLLHSFFEPEYVKAIDDLQIWTRPEFVPLRRVMDRATLKNAVGMPGEGRVDSIAIILRPHLKEFLAEACNYFSMVVIWSAGKPKYVEYVRTLIFADMPKPAILLTSEQCQIDPATGRQTKFLKVLFEKFPQQIRPDNTLLIDDRSDNTEPNGANGILIPEYRPLPVLEVDNPRKLSLTDNDTCLLDLMRWLKSPEVLQARDIRKTDRSRIFG